MKTRETLRDGGGQESALYRGRASETPSPGRVKQARPLGGCCSWMACLLRLS